MKKGTSVTQAIQKIKNKEINGKDLPKELLLDVIGFLHGRGEGSAVISALLGYSDRQIRRYIKEVKRANSFKYTEEYWGEYIGNYMQGQELALNFLTRVYNNSQNTLEARAMTSVAYMKYSNEYTRTLQGLGCLPMEILKNKDRLYDRVPIVDSSKNESDAGDDPRLKKLALLSPLENEHIRKKLEAFSLENDQKANEFINEVLKGHGLSDDPRREDKRV